MVEAISAIPAPINREMRAIRMGTVLELFVTTVPASPTLIRLIEMKMDAEMPVIPAL